MQPQSNPTANTAPPRGYQPPRTVHAAARATAAGLLLRIFDLTKNQEVSTESAIAWDVALSEALAMADALRTGRDHILSLLENEVGQ